MAGALAAFASHAHTIVVVELAVAQLIRLVFHLATWMQDACGLVNRAREHVELLPERLIRADCARARLWAPQLLPDLPQRIAPAVTPGVICV